MVGITLECPKMSNLVSYIALSKINMLVVDLLKRENN